MMKRIITLFFCLTVFTVMGQSFTAEVGTLFLGEKPTEQFGNLKILSGVIKKGDKIDFYAETGRKFTATITKIKDDNDKDASQIKAGEYGFFDLTFTEDPSSGKDYLHGGHKGFPMGFKANVAEIKAEADKKVTESVSFKATLDGKAFRGKVTYKGATFWRKGVKNLVEKPYLQLQFRAVVEPDDRNLTIQIFYPKESTAKYSVKDMEVNFSGTSDGNTAHTEMYGFVNGKGDTDFSVEITKWQKVSGKKAIISGKISGDLKEVKLYGTPKLKHRLTDGVFENVEVEIFNEQADFKQMTKSAGGESQKN